MIYTSNRRLLSGSGYTLASTDNSAGWRPGYQRLGDLSRGRAYVRPRTLGDDQSDPLPSGADTSTQVSWIARQFQQMQTALLGHENDVRTMAQAGTPASADVGQQLLQLRADFESALAQYNLVYRASVGSTPSIPGLQGLGNPVIIAGVFAVILAAIAVWWQHERNIGSQIAVQQQQSQTQGAVANQLPVIQQQIADAQASGDSALVAQLQAQYSSLLGVVGATGPQAPATGIGAFLSGNFGWLALAAIGVIVAVKI